MQTNKSKLPNIVVIMILTLITAVFWISFGVYRAFSEDTPVAVPEEVITPLTPKLDSQTLEKMKTRIYP